MNTITLISGQWMPSRLRFPLLFLLPLLLLGGSLLPSGLFLPIHPVVVEPLASEYPEQARIASEGANLVATDRLFPILSDELEIREQISQGVLPTWNPRAGIGAPLAATSMAAPWNPLRIPLLWMDPARAGAWHALLALVVAGLGMMMFLEGRGLKFTAAMFGALAYQSCGYFAANLHYLMKVDAAAWAPWCLWGVDLMYRGRKNAGLIVFFGLTASALSGFPQVFLFVAALTLAWILKRALEAIRSSREQRRWKSSLAACLLFGGLGITGGSLHLLPMLEAARESTRGPQEPERIHEQALPHAALLTMVLPSVFGAPSSTTPAHRDASVWWLLDEDELQQGLNANRLEWHLFAGATVLALVLAGLFAKFREARFPALVILASCGFLFGWPLFEYLYGLPGANLGAPARAAPILALGLAWLSALGFDALLEGHTPARLGTLLVSVTLGSASFVLWLGIQPEVWAQELEVDLQSRFAVDLEVVRSFFTPEQASQVAHRVLGALKSLMLFCFLVFILGIYAGRLTVRGSGVAGCALLVFEATTASLPQTAVPPARPSVLFPPSQTVQAIADAAGDGRVLKIDRSESGIDEVLAMARPNLLSTYGVAELSDYNALPPKRLHDLWQAFDPGGTYRGGLAALSDPGRIDAPLLDVLRVTCVLSTEAIEHPRLQLRHRAPNLFVYHRTGAFGPARVVPKLSARRDDSLERLTSAGHDFRNQAIHGDESFGTGANDVLFKPGEIQVQRPAADRIDVALSRSDGGYLVLHEGWARDWKATINGKDAEVLLMDHAFLGLRVPSGSSIIRLKYEPWSLRVGFALTILSLLLALWITRRRHLIKNRTTLSRGLLPHAYSEPR